MKAYLVGFKDLLEAVYIGNSEFIIANVPAGEHDIIVTGSLAISSTSLHLLDKDNGSEKSDEHEKNGNYKRGKRVSGKKSLVGVESKVGEVELDPLTIVTGKVDLQGRSNFAGVDVYVPGTSYIVKSDDLGNFSFPELPPGKHDFYYDFDGYHRGKLSKIDVPTSERYQLDSLTLVLSTGALGSIFTKSGRDVVETYDPEFLVVSTENAALMMIADNASFTNAKWEPVRTVYKFHFPTEGAKTLYIKFADSNGLESSPSTVSFTVKIFPDSLALKIGDGSGASGARKVPLSIPSVTNASEMMISYDAAFTGGTWVPFKMDSEAIFPSLGGQALFVKFRAKDGQVSPTYSASHNVQILLNGSVSINNGAAVSTSRNVTLGITSPADAVKMNISVNGSYLGEEPVASTKSISFIGDGLKTAYIKFIDRDGIETVPVSDSIIFNPILNSFSTYDDISWSLLQGMDIAPDDSVYAIGELYRGTLPGADSGFPVSVGSSGNLGFVVKMNKALSKIWIRRAAQQATLIRGTAVLVDNSAVVLGQGGPGFWGTLNTCSAGSFVSKINSDGSQGWETCLETTAQGGVIKKLSNGKLGVVLAFGSNQSTRYKKFYVISTSGTIESSSAYNNSISEITDGMASNGSNEFFIVGQTSGSSYGSVPSGQGWACYVEKFSSSLSFDWGYQNNDYYCRILSATGTGGVKILSVGYNYSSYRIIELSNMGAVTSNVAFTPPAPIAGMFDIMEDSTRYFVFGGLNDNMSGYSSFTIPNEQSGTAIVLLDKNSLSVSEQWQYFEGSEVIKGDGAYVYRLNSDGDLVLGGNRGRSVNQGTPEAEDRYGVTIRTIKVAN